MSHYKQGNYRPINFSKCLNSSPQYLSGWELQCFSKLDMNDRVIKWGANSFSISYYNEVKRRVCKYFLDIYCEYLKPDNSIVKFIIEVKPDNQLLPPSKPKRLTSKSQKNYNFNLLQWKTNQNKWNAANQFGLANNMHFIIRTDKGLYTFNNNQLTKISNKGFF